MNTSPEEPNQESPSWMKRSGKGEETLTLGSMGASSPSRPLKKRKLTESFKDNKGNGVKKSTAAATAPAQTTVSSSNGRLSWNDQRNVTHLQQDPAQVFPKEYKESDVWYSREDYEQFLMDRIHTIERRRGSSIMPEPSQNNGMMWMDRNSNNSRRFSRDTAAASVSNQTDSHDQRQQQQPDHCMRGLEPFQDRSTHQDMHSKRKLHQSTVITEQVRQAMLGIQDPERFRFLVAPQSNMALERAQELAAMDEEEVYPTRVQRQRKRNSRRCSMSAALPMNGSSSASGRSVADMGQHHRRADSYLSMFNNPAMTRSVLSASNLLNPSVTSTVARRNSMTNTQSFSSLAGLATETTTTPTTSSNDKNMPYPSLFSSSIRQMQEKNAKRLMEMYQQPDGGRNGRNLFRFSLRRDSLLGSMNGGNMAAPQACKTEDMQQQNSQGLMAMMPMATRFHIRRDSLNHLVTK